MKTTIQLLFIAFSISILFNCSPKKEVPIEKTTSEEIEEFLDGVTITSETLNNNEIPDFMKPLNFNFYDNFEEWQETSKDSKSPYFIDSLLVKMYRDESGFSKKEQAYLIIGGTSLEGYKSSELEKIYKEITLAYENGNHEKVIELGKNCLDIFPLSLTAMIYLDNSYTALNKSAEHCYVCILSNILFKGITSTSTKEDIKKPHIIFSKHDADTYAKYYALGANYTFEKSTTDEQGNEILIYNHIMGKDYFIIPKKK